jgi:branched-chain amino acid transport system substrate-binding protein
MTTGQRAGRGSALRVAAAAASVVLLATACSGEGSSTGGGDCAADTPFKIGGLLGLTGAYSALGESEQKAIQLLAKQTNAAGGVNGHPLEVVFADTTSSESEAVNQLRRLATQEKVTAVLGPSSSGEGIAVKPIAGSLKIPTVVPASSNAIITPPQDAKYMFKEFPASSDSLTAQLTYARDKGLHRVAILAANNAYGQEPVKALPDVIKNFNGLQLVASETFPPDATDVTAQLSAVARAKPDITLVWAVNPASAVVARSAANSNLPGLLFHSPGAATPLYIQVAGKAAEGTLVQGSKIGVPDAIKQGDPQYKIVHDFAQSWRTEFKTEPNQFAANGWDALLLVAQAL